MARTQLLVLGILLTTSLIVMGQASATATRGVQIERNAAPLLHPNGTGDVEIHPFAPVAPGVVLVALRPGLRLGADLLGVQSSDTSLNEALARVGVRGVEPVFRHVRRASAVASTGGGLDLSLISRLRLAANADIAAVVQELKANPAVEYAEPDYLAHIITTPNDPLYAGQWGLGQIKAPAAWDVITGTTDVVIAVVDSGVDTNHPDLAGQLWMNPGETVGNGIDDDSNGYVDDINGWNFVNNNADLSDNTGHGTEVSGVIAAATNNNSGVAGVCWGCRLMIVKVTQPGGIANYSDIAAGAAYAAQKGAKVINLSLGGSSDSATLRAAIAAASQTAVIVGGTGNDNSSASFYPAAYDEVLAVAGTTISDTKVGTSNYGTWVDVSAPGEAITTTFSGGGYGSTSGTSMAAPFASGVAGLLRGLHPEWPVNLVRAQVIQTADNIDGANPGYAGQLGGGRLNASRAVTTTAVPDIRFVGHAANGQGGGTLKVGSAVTLTVTLRNDWLSATTVTATLTTTDTVVSITKATAAWGSISSGQSATNEADPFQMSVAAGAPYNQPIPFSLQVSADGKVASLPFTATTESAVVTVGETLASDTVWTSDRVYLANNVIVPSGITLTIQPGTLVKFNPGRAMVVQGTLIADGTLQSPIRFTSAAASPAPGDWGGTYSGNEGGIIFASSSQPAQFDGSGNYQGGSIIRYAIIEFSKGLTLQNAAPFINRNLVWQNSGQGAVFYNGYGGASQPLISHNRIVSNTSLALNVQQGQAIVRQNLIASNSGGLYVSHNQTVISNTITANGRGCSDSVSGICLQFSTSSTRLTGNNIYANRATYDVSMGIYTTQITATGNYWGTTHQADIQARIYDSSQDLNVGTVNFVPFRTEPEPTAPPMLYALSLSPGSPVGIQEVTFALTFSASMDQSIDPVVTFGATTPYTSYVVMDNAQWVSDRVWRATYGITSLVARGTYTVSVSGGRGTDGMEIPTDTRFGFAVDYGGQITDRTPPTAPAVIAGGKAGDATAVQATWSASDPDSSISGYRYAIGSAPGATDIVNWTTTSATAMSRSGLGLIAGRRYWVAVQARNVGGLWSASRYSAFIAGESPVLTVFLPLVLKERTLGW